MLSPAAMEEIEKRLPAMDAVLIGCGLGIRCETKVSSKHALCLGGVFRIGFPECGKNILIECLVGRNVFTENFARFDDQLCGIRIKGGCNEILS